MIGRILGGRYEILEKIGEGGMAIVYKAKCHLLNRFVAIKILKDEFIDDEDFNKKFKRESQAAASLSHPNILAIYDVGNEIYKDKNYPYIVMEYIQGGTLKDIINKRGKLSVDETIYYGLQIAEAIQHAHSNNIIHRDIKPQNIMVTKDNRIKVTDFGIARAATSSTLTTSSNVLGSVHYFSPEQARGGYTDERSDIYSLGILLYELVTGKLPYEGENLISVALKHVQDEIISPRDIEPTIPKSLEAIILKCVQKSQGDRYNKVSSLIIDLKNTTIENDNLSLYSKEDEEFKTRLIPKIDENIDKENNSDSKEIDKPKNKRKKNENLKLTISAILLALLLVTSLFYSFFWIKGLLKVEEVTVPNLIGMDQKEAQEEIEKLDLKFSVKGYVKSDEFEAGEVTHQNIEADTKVKKGYTIEVTISEGQDLVRVPGLINRSLEEARELLEEVGLTIGNTNYKHSDTTPKDAIMKQEPEANTYLEPGSKVNVIISEGEEIKKVLMPRLINENIIDAQNTLLALGLRVKEVIPQSNENVEKDRVIWQSYEAGTELESNSEVTLYVSTGPEEKPDQEPPEDSNNGSDEDQSGDKDSENTNKEIIINFSIPEEEEEVKVKITKNSSKVYEKKHKTSEGEINKSFKGKVGDVFQVYFDGNEQSNLTKKIEE